MPEIFCEIYLLIFFFFFKLRPWNGTQTHNQLACKPTLAHTGKLASMAKWFGLPLRTKWLWVRILLLSRNHQILDLFQAKIFLSFS